MSYFHSRPQRRRAELILQQLSEETATILLAADPTVAKEFVPYLACLMNSQPDQGKRMLAEDMDKAAAYLWAVKHLQSRGESIRLLDVQDGKPRPLALGDLYHIIKPHLAELATREQSPMIRNILGQDINPNRAEEEAALIAAGELEVLVETDKIRVTCARSYPAARHVNRNAQWCTGLAGTDRHCKTYLETGDLFQVERKGMEDKFQFHFGALQISNRADQPQSLETVRHLLNLSETETREWQEALVQGALQDAVRRGTLPDIMPLLDSLDDAELDESWLQAAEALAAQAPSEAQAPGAGQLAKALNQLPEAYQPRVLAILQRLADGQDREVRFGIVDKLPKLADLPQSLYEDMLTLAFSMVDDDSYGEIQDGSRGLLFRSLPVLNTDQQKRIMNDLVGLFPKDGDIHMNITLELLPIVGKLPLIHQHTVLSMAPALWQIDEAEGSGYFLEKYCSVVATLASDLQPEGLKVIEDIWKKTVQKTGATNDYQAQKEQVQIAREIAEGLLPHLGGMAPDLQSHAVKLAGKLSDGRQREPKEAVVKNLLPVIDDLQPAQQAKALDLVDALRACAWGLSDSTIAEALVPATPFIAPELIPRALTLVLALGGDFKSERAKNIVKDMVPIFDKYPIEHQPQVRETVRRLSDTDDTLVSRLLARHLPPEVKPETPCRGRRVLPSTPAV